MSYTKIKFHNWSEKVYRLIDVAEKLKISSCLVKSDEEICSELDCFEVLCFKHIYCVRAFKVSTPDDRDVTEDAKNNNSNQHTLTSGDEVFIPLDYTNRGSILPLYGETHVCNTVEELLMTFPRYVLIEENLKVCSDSKIIQLNAGSELELLRNAKDKHNQDKLICRYGAQTLQLSPSDIGRFRVRPDPNLYSVKDVLQRLKLPQIIDFKEMQQDQWEKEANLFQRLALEQNYTGKFLLTGLFKDKVAIAVSLAQDGRPNSQPFLIPLSSDLLQQLMFRIAFRGDYFQIDFKDAKYPPKEFDNDKDKKKTPKKKKEMKLKRGKSEADISQSQQIPFELTYTQYRFPQPTNKSPNQGDTILKKVQSAIKTAKGKFKKASSKDVAAIQDSVTPEPIRKASNKLYPVLANFMNEENSIYDCIKNETLGRKSSKRQSQFYFEIEAPKTASAPSEENVYHNLDDILTEKQSNEEPIENETPASKRAENLMKSKVDNNQATPNRKGAVNETEEDNSTNNTRDTEEDVYMNYNHMATLQIRRRSSPLQKSVDSFSKSPAIDEVSRDWNYNEAVPTRPRVADEKSDISTDEEWSCAERSDISTGEERSCAERSDISTGEERSYAERSDISTGEEWSCAERSDISTGEERSCAESNSSVNTDRDDCEIELEKVVPNNKVPPVPVKRNSTFPATTTIVADSERDASNFAMKETTTPLEKMSIMELCEILQQCGMSRISKLCKEHSLDGAFICALPVDSLQEQPFSLSNLEVMKLTMMQRGWKPKIK